MILAEIYVLYEREELGMSRPTDQGPAKIHINHQTDQGIGVS